MTIQDVLQERMEIDVQLKELDFSTGLLNPTYGKLMEREFVLQQQCPHSEDFKNSKEVNCPYCGKILKAKE